MIMSGYDFLKSHVLSYWWNKTGTSAVSTV